MNGFDHPRKILYKSSYETNLSHKGHNFFLSRMNWNILYRSYSFGINVDAESYTTCPSNLLKDTLKIEFVGFKDISYCLQCRNTCVRWSK